MAFPTANAYVDSNASGANDGTSWTDAAADIEYLIETIGTSADDVIYVASDHSKVYASNPSLTFPSGQHYISVNSTTDVFEAGAYENSGNFVDVTHTLAEGARVIFSGISIGADDQWFHNGSGSQWFFHGCTLTGGQVGSDGLFLFANDGMEARFIDCLIYTTGLAAYIQGGSGSRHLYRNLTAHASHTKMTTLLQNGGGGGGGSTFELEDCDLAGIIAVNGALINDMPTVDDRLYIKMRRCKFPSGFTVFDTTPVSNNYIIDIAECGEGDQYYYSYYEEGGLGIAEIDTTQYVDDASVTYDGTNEFSIQIDTEATANALSPLRYKLGTLSGQDLTADKTVTVEFSGPASLTDTTVWLEIEVQDTTDQALGAVQSTQGSDPLATGTALSAGSATWATTTPTEYKIAKALGAIANASNSNVVVTVCVGKASVAALNVSMPTIAAT